MFLTAIAMLVVGQAAPLSCPVMGSPIEGKGAETLQYNGVQYATCCAGCGAQFQADPAKYLKAAKDKTIGVFLFDPTTGLRIQPEKASGFTDYAGIRYYFASDSGKATFASNPKKYTVQPKKEALFCPVSKEAVKSYDKASGYGDYNGVRYYFCCGGCDKPFAQDPAKYAPNAAQAIQTPKVLASQQEVASFVCKHCGRKITESDLSKTCSVCKCGKTNAQCKPAGAN